MGAALAGAAARNATARPALSKHDLGYLWLEFDMLKWALIFAVVALIAGALGFTGMAGAAAGIAKLLFFVAVIGFVLFLALGAFVGKKISGG